MAADARQSLLEATQELLWRFGYESTSPKAIMSQSGTGQGSFYHHFESKKALAVAALELVADDMAANLARAFDPSTPPLQQIEAWLHLPRAALRGCRLGRHAMEQSILDDDELRAPLVRYFKTVERAMRSALRDAQEAGALRRDLNADELAVTLVAAVQGGYVLSRVHRDPSRMDDAIDGALQLLRIART